MVEDRDSAGVHDAVQAAHGRVPPALGLRRRPHEPREEHLVRRVVHVLAEPVLVVAVLADYKTEADHWIAGLELGAAAVLARPVDEPFLDGVVREWVHGPFDDLVAK